MSEVAGFYYAQCSVLLCFFNQRDEQQLKVVEETNIHNHGKYS